jgi:AcrR family transcriptional regulator
MEGIAARAGVGKPTLYRWWPDRLSVAMAALMDAESVAPSARKDRSALKALRKQLQEVAAVFSTPAGRAAAAMITAADPDSELARAFRNHFVLARREAGRELLAQAVARGEIRHDADIDVVLDMIYGALFFRLLMGHARLEPAFIKRLLNGVTQGLRA